MAQSNRSRWLSATVIFLAYSAVVISIIPYHEPWRDEGQAWLIARDRTPVGIVQQMGYEGSPALWHFTLAPFAKAGLPYVWIQIVHVFFALGFAALICFASPFHTWQKFALLFSYFFIFEYAVIARNYNQSVMLLFAIAAIFHRRKKWAIVLGVLVALLANTNLHSTLIAATIGGILLLEMVLDRAWKPSRITGLGIALVGGLLAVYQMIPASDFLFTEKNERNWIALELMAKHAFFPGYEFDGRVFAFIGLGVWLATAFAVRKHWQLLAALILPCLGFAGVHVLKHAGMPRHWGFVMLLCVFVLWVHMRERGVRQTTDGDRADVGVPARWWRRFERSSGGTVAIAFFIVLFTAAPFGLRKLKWDYQEPFSGSSDMAAFIKQQAITEPIAAFPAPHGSAILPYLPDRKLWYLDWEQQGTYIRMTAKLGQDINMPQKQAIKRFHDRFDDQAAFLLLHKPVEDPDGQGLKLVHHAPGAKWSGADESFYLYRRQLVSAERGGE